MSKEHAITRRDLLKTGACVSVLGALGAGLGEAAGTLSPVEAVAETATRTIPGFCDGCLYKKCKVNYTIKDGVLVGIDGAPDGLYNEGRLCARGQSQIAGLYNAYRVKTPLRRTNPEKGLDVDPGWEEISWEEAIDIAVDKIGSCVAENPQNFYMFSGFGGYSSIHWRPFATALGTKNIVFSPGAFCSGHSGSETLHGSFFECADGEYCNFKIEIGRGQLNNAMADGEAQGETTAVARGMKIVKVDPRCSTLFRNSEWVPIKPQTELAFLLAIENVILFENGKYDIDFVRDRTNVVYLIDEAGTYVRQATTNKPYVWDTVTNAPTTFDNEAAVPALEGSFEIEGVACRPAFEAIKERVVEYTPEWQEPITTIPAAKVRELANRLVEEARIGSTIAIDGFEFPLRPACISIYKGLTNHQQGHLAYFTAMTINILLGAWDVPGGSKGYVNKKYAIDEDWHPVVYSIAAPNVVQYPPAGPDAAGMLPLSHDTGYMYTNIMKEPEKYRYENRMPKVAMTYGCNLFSKGGSEEEISEALRKPEYMIAISTVFDEHTAFADLVLPEANHLETPFLYNRDFDRPFKDHVSAYPFCARNAVVEPLYQGRHEGEIFVELANRLGILPVMNTLVKAMTPVKTDFDLMSTNVMDAWDAWAAGVLGPEWNFSKVAAQGQAWGEPKSKAETYQYFYRPGKQIKFPIYHVRLMGYKDALHAALDPAGVEHPNGWDFVDEYFQPVPHWYDPPELTHPGEEFDLNMVGWRNSLFIHDTNNMVGNHILNEVATQNPLYGKLVINPATAAEKGLKENDMVYVENRYGSKIGPVPLKFAQSIHPQAVGVAGGQARRTFDMDPVNGAGTVSWNRLCSIDWSAIDPVTGAIEISPAVKITKA